MFEPMTRGIGAGNSGRSVGLGLFIVREIASAHGGDVGVVVGRRRNDFSITCPR